MVRAGAAYYGNPYKNIAGEKGNRLLLSGGLGYRNKGMFVDLGYVHNIIKDVHAPYRLQSTPYSIANIKGMGGNVVLTVGFKI
jgi:long-subunit fatty acid transport protein